MRMTSATSQGGRVTKIYPSIAELVPAYESLVDRVDQWPYADDGARGANRRRYVPNARVRAAAGWSVDRFLPPCGAWQNCGAACAAQSFSECRHERRPLYRYSKLCGRRWVVPRHDDRWCWETNTPWVFSSANIGVRPPAAWASGEHRGLGSLCPGGCESPCADCRCHSPSTATLQFGECPYRREP